MLEKGPRILCWEKQNGVLRVGWGMWTLPLHRPVIPLRPGDQNCLTVPVPAPPSSPLPGAS